MANSSHVSVFAWHRNVDNSHTRTHTSGTHNPARRKIHFTASGEGVFRCMFAFEARSQTNNKYVHLPIDNWVGQRWGSRCFGAGRGCSRVDSSQFYTILKRLTYEWCTGVVVVLVPRGLRTMDVMYGLPNGRAFFLDTRARRDCVREFVGLGVCVCAVVSGGLTRMTRTACVCVCCVSVCVCVCVCVSVL